MALNLTLTREERLKNLLTSLKLAKDHLNDALLDAQALGLKANTLKLLGALVDETDYQLVMLGPSQVFKIDGVEVTYEQWAKEKKLTQPLTEEWLDRLGGKGS